VIGMSSAQPHLGLISYGAAFTGLAAGSPAEQQLKLATILYDQTVFPVRSDHLESVIQITSDEEYVAPGDLRGCWISSEEFCPAAEVSEIAIRFTEPRWDLVSDSAGKLYSDFEFVIDVEVKRQYGHLLESSSSGYSHSLRDHVCSATGLIEGWKMLMRHVYCSLVGFSDFDKLLADRVFNASDNRGMDFAARLDIVIPSVRALPWPDIMKLRTDARIRDFRNWYWERTLAARTDLDSFEREVMGALWAAVKTLRPKIAGETMKGFLSNLPLPIPVNPASIVLSAKAVRDAVQFQRDYGWLLFIMAARDA
jgi:hypothetical protein